MRIYIYGTGRYASNFIGFAKEIINDVKAGGVKAADAYLYNKFMNLSNE